MKTIYKFSILVGSLVSLILGSGVIFAQIPELGGPGRPGPFRPTTPSPTVTAPKTAPTGESAVLKPTPSTASNARMTSVSRFKSMQTYLFNKKFRDFYGFIRQAKDETFLFKPQAGDDILQGGAGGDVLVGGVPEEKDAKIKRVNLCNMINVLIKGISAIPSVSGSTNAEIGNDVRSALVSALGKLSKDLDCEFTLQDFLLTGGKNIDPLPPEWEDSDTWYDLLLEAVTNGLMKYGSRGWTNAYVIAFYLGDSSEPATVEGVRNSARKAAKSLLDSGLKLVAAMIADGIKSSDFQQSFDTILKKTEAALTPK